MKHFFNMVEILLALGVTAVGIAGLMAVIPLGLNANRDAMTDTFTADIANSKFAEMEIWMVKNFGGAAQSKPAAANFPTWHPLLNSSEKASDISWTSLPEEGVNFSPTGNSQIYHVLVGKKGAATPDFAADMAYWTSYPTDIAEYNSSQTDLVRVYIEISWPVTTEYGQRQKRTYVREYLNPNITLPEQ